MVSDDDDFFLDFLYKNHLQGNDHIMTCSCHYGFILMFVPLCMNCLKKSVILQHNFLISSSCPALQYF